MYCNTTNCVKTMVCSVAINSLEITLILQPARSDVKVSPARTHGNRLKFLCSFFFVTFSPGHVHKKLSSDRLLVSYGCQKYEHSTTDRRTMRYKQTQLTN